MGDDDLHRRWWHEGSTGVVSRDTDSSDPQPPLSSTGETQAPWPACMAPDGGECCPQYRALLAERDALAAELAALKGT